MYRNPNIKPSLAKVGALIIEIAVEIGGQSHEFYYDRTAAKRVPHVASKRESYKHGPPGKGRPCYFL
jgi:hypothetical protein